MFESHTTRVLAIDGGGTRCRIALQEGQDITCVEAGAANVSTNFERAVAEIRSGLEAICTKRGLTQEALYDSAAFIGLAGITGANIAERLAQLLPFRQLRVDDDRPAALRGALLEQNGLIAHCGTGSFFGHQRNGHMSFCGGWGLVLGDEASAAWVGRAALSGTLEVVDGFREASLLSAAVLDRFSDAAGIVEFSQSATPKEFGEIAPDVTAFAAQKDALANEIMTAGAAEIGRNLTKLGWQPGLKICLTGGIGPQFLTYLADSMQVDVTAPQAEPLTGALSLARELDRGGST